MGSAAGKAWVEAWRQRRFRLQAALAFPALALALAALSRFVGWVERRPGATLSDPVLALVRPRDVTWLTFAVIYAGLAAGLVLLLGRPRRLVAAAQAYVLMVALRVLAMWAVPLDPPPGLIPLRDPLVELFSTGRTLTRDLFFSGHTATLFLLALAAPGRPSRAFFLGCTAAVAGCLLLQHVHYAVDVLAAPLAALASWRAAIRLWPDGLRP